MTDKTLLENLRGAYTGDESRANLMHYCDRAADRLELLQKVCAEVLDLFEARRDILAMVGPKEGILLGRIATILNNHQ